MGTGTTYYFAASPDGGGISYGIKKVSKMGFYMYVTGDRMFWFDNLVWKSTTTGTTSITVKNISDNSVVAGSTLTWSGVTVGSTRWKAADQYIEVKNDYYGSSWGLQIYTDNKASNASPKYTGTGNPVGLVNTTTTTVALPLAWRIVDVTTSTVSVMQGEATHPTRIWESQLGNQYPCYNWMIDKSSGSFTNSADNVTAWDIRGIQHAESTWGGAMSPNYVYIAADFTNALTPATYTTRKLVLELFHD
jgi:hypothetical protein